MHPFRINWWSHICKDDVFTFIHKQYMVCDKCGAYNGKRNVTRKAL
jgi:hypothetical protein